MSDDGVALYVKTAIPLHQRDDRVSGFLQEC